MYQVYQTFCPAAIYSPATRRSMAVCGLHKGPNYGKPWVIVRTILEDVRRASSYDFVP